ncbi:MAG: hypothetical protein ACLQB1_11950 [Streptosporangiaceae bacterium]
MVVDGGDRACVRLLRELRARTAEVPGEWPAAASCAGRRGGRRGFSPAASCAPSAEGMAG